MKRIKSAKMNQGRAVNGQSCGVVETKPLFTPTVNEYFWWSARQQDNYGASSCSRCEKVSMPPNNCPPKLLTSSRTSQLLSNILYCVFDKCLLWMVRMKRKLLEQTSHGPTSHWGLPVWQRDALPVCAGRFLETWLFSWAKSKHVKSIGYCDLTMAGSVHGLDIERCNRLMTH